MEEKVKCKYCEYEFEKGMAICPNCKKRQNNNVLQIIGWILIIFNVWSLYWNVINNNFSIPEEAMPKDFLTTLGLIFYLLGYNILAIIGYVLLIIGKPKSINRVQEQSKEEIKENIPLKNKIKNEEPAKINYKYYRVDIEKECGDENCDEYINYIIKNNFESYNKYLYNGFTNKDIKEKPGKYYAINNKFLPCKLNFNRYEVFGINNQNYFGHIFQNRNDELKEIIDNKNIICYNLVFYGGKSKEYDFVKEKIIRN